jgi:hypothetical protein
MENGHHALVRGARGRNTSKREPFPTTLVTATSPFAWVAIHLPSRRGAASDAIEGWDDVTGKRADERHRHPDRRSMFPSTAVRSSSTSSGSMNSYSFGISGDSIGARSSQCVIAARSRAACYRSGAVAAARHRVDSARTQRLRSGRRVLIADARDDESLRIEGEIVAGDEEPMFAPCSGRRAVWF